MLTISVSRTHSNLGCNTRLRQPEPDCVVIFRLSRRFPLRVIRDVSGIAFDVRSAGVFGHAAHHSQTVIDPLERVFLR